MPRDTASGHQALGTTSEWSLVCATDSSCSESQNTNIVLVTVTNPFKRSEQEEPERSPLLAVVRSLSRNLQEPASVHVESV